MKFEVLDTIQKFHNWYIYIFIYIFDTIIKVIHSDSGENIVWGLLYKKKNLVFILLDKTELLSGNLAYHWSSLSTACWIISSSYFLVRSCSYCPTFNKSLTHFHLKLHFGIWKSLWMPPYYSHLCIFGCHYLVHISSHKWTKAFTVVSNMCFFGGRVMIKKTILCYDPMARSICSFRNTSFLNTFPLIPQILKSHRYPAF